MGPQSDHDLLIRIDENTKNLLESFHAHVEADTTQFRNIGRRTAWAEKMLYTGLGALIVLQFFGPTITKAIGLG